MTTDAGANHLGVVNIGGSHRRPAGRKTLVTCVTHIRGIDMVGTLAAGINTIVTGNTTVSGKTAVVDGCGNPLHRAVTNVALIGGGNMIGTFSGGDYAVVAG